MPQGKGTYGKKRGRPLVKRSIPIKKRRKVMPKKEQKAEVRYALKVRLGRDGRLTRIRPLTLTWLHLSTARILTMQRSQRVVNVKEDNGSASRMEKAELGKDRH
jgi:hypothetical protein